MAERLSETNGIVYAIKPGDHQSAGIDSDSFIMRDFRKATFVIQFAALTGDALLTVNSGASAGTKTTAETFHTRLADAVQGSATADTFGDRTSSASLTLTAATYQNKTLLVEIETDNITQDQPWITLNLSSAASALNASAIAILEEARYKANDLPTALV